MISVVIPAYNEERWLPPTLRILDRATDYFLSRGGQSVETLVVDNASTDRTAPIARSLGATVVEEPVRNVAAVRNTGARAARGEVLVFLDADVAVPDTLLSRISDLMSDRACIGGAVDARYVPSRVLVRAYLQIWRLLGTLAGLAQGATQFCRRDVFLALGGYDEALYMGEDVDFYWRLSRRARAAGLHVRYIDDLCVLPSCRRFDQWPLWRTLVWTNPLIVLLFRRRKAFWHGWYEVAPR